MYRPWELGALIAVIFNFLCYLYFFFPTIFSPPLTTQSIHVSSHTNSVCVFFVLCEYLYYVVFNPMFVGAIIQYSLFCFFPLNVKKLMPFIFATGWSLLWVGGAILLFSGEAGGVARKISTVFVVVVYVALKCPTF